MVGDARQAPPELSRCEARDWIWDGVRFSMSGEADGCWLRAQVGSQALLLVPERPGGFAEPLDRADVWILPRRAEDARRLLGAVASPPSLLLAGLAAAEWNASAWHTLQQELQQRDVRIVSSAHGAVHLRMKPASAPAVSQGGWWQPGIWSSSRADVQCRR
jgi:hypothetical protein